MVSVLNILQETDFISIMAEVRIKVLMFTVILDIVTYVTDII